MIDYTEAYEDNEIVGYHNGKAIVINELGNIFYCEVPENLLGFGETVHPDDLTSVDELPAEEQEKIISLFSGKFKGV